MQSHGLSFVVGPNATILVNRIMLILINTYVKTTCTSPIFSSTIKMSPWEDRLMMDICYLTMLQMLGNIWIER